MQKKLPV